MSNLPDVKRLLIEDFSDVEDNEWLDRMFYPINSFNEQTYNLLNKNVTLTDNIQCAVTTTTFTTASDYVANKTFTPIIISWNVRSQPKMVFLGKINEASGTIIKEAVTLTDWTLSGPNQIQVRFLTGLKNSTKYTATFLAY